MPTWRLSVVSVARYTSPIPPTPIWAVTSCLSRRVPVASAKSLNYVGQKGLRVRYGVNSGGRCNMSRDWRSHGATTWSASHSRAKGGVVAPLASRGIAVGHRPRAGPDSQGRVSRGGRGGRPAPAAAAAVTPRPDPGRAGGGVAGARAWARAARDRTRPGTRRVNGESRSAAARRPAPVSRRRRGPPGVEAKSASQALSLDHLSRVARRRRDAARVRVVAAADRGLAATGVS